MTVSYAINPNTREICYSTKSGLIYKYNPDDEDQVIYNANEQDYLSIPRELSFDKDGNLYFTDIGLRTVSMISPEGKLSHVIYEGEPGEDTADKYIYYYCDAINGIVTVTSDYIAYTDNGEIVTETDWGFSPGLRIRIVSIWAAVIAAAAVLGFFLVRGAIYVLYRVAPGLQSLQPGLLAVLLA